MRWTSRIFAAALVACASPACGNEDDGDTRVRTSGNVCERWAALSGARGCTAPASGCDPAPTCAAEYDAWFDCLEGDLMGGCICEGSDGDLNCEGSYKPNEGSARCVAEVEAMNTCDPS